MSDELDLQPSLGVPAAPAPGPAAPQSVSVMQAVSQPFETQNWAPRIAVASLWMLIPVLGFIAIRGWASDGMARMLKNHPDPFPRLRLANFFTYLRRGWPSAAVQLACMAAVVFSVVASIGLINAGFWATLFAGGTLAFVLLGVGLALGAGLSAWVLLVSNAVLTRAEISGRLGMALRSGQVWPQVRAAWGKTLRAYALFLPLASLLLAVGGTFLCLGLIPAWVVIEMAATHLRFQIYQAQLQAGGQSLPAPPSELLPSETKLLQRGKLEEK